MKKPQMITVYSTPTCKYCKEAKAFLTKHGFPYTEVDVSKSKEAREKLINVSEQLGVPVIEILIELDNDKKEIVIGFDEPLLREILHIKDEQI